jgi:hypothetical protein
MRPRIKAEPQHKEKPRICADDTDKKKGNKGLSSISVYPR